MKKSIILALVMLLIVSAFAGCTAPANTPATDSTPVEVSEPASTSEATTGTGEAGEPIELTFFGIMPQYIDDIEAIADAYTAENPNVHIRVSMEGDTYLNTLRTRISMGEIPDIFMTDGYAATEPYVEYIEDLSGRPLLDNVFENAVLAVTMDGKVTGIPVENTAMGLIYNKQIFAEYGLSVPKTFSEFKSVCETLMANDIVPVVMQCKDTWRIGDIICQGLAAADVPAQLVADINAGKTTLAETQEMRDMLNWYQYCVETGQKDPLSYDTNTTMTYFASGKGAMFFCGAAAYSTLMEFDETGDYGLMGLPISDTSEAKCPCDVYQIMHVSKDSANKEEAIKFLEYMMTSEAGANMCKARFGIPAWKNVEGASDANPLYVDAIAYRDAGLAGCYGFMLAPSGFEMSSGEIVQNMILGNADIDATLTALDANWQELLANQ